MSLSPSPVCRFAGRALAAVTVCALLTSGLLKAPAAAASRVREAGRRTPTNTSEAVRARAARAYGELPLQFESNRGQADPRYDFVTRAGGYTALLSSTEAVFALHEGGAGGGGRPPVTVPWVKSVPPLRRSGASPPAHLPYSGRQPAHQRARSFRMRYRAHFKCVRLLVYS